MKRLMLILLFFLLLCGSSLAYSPPIGIPNPGFGVDDVRPSRPADWSSEIAGYYYVNYSTGTNTGRTYGTPTAPRQTIPNPAPAGSYIEVHGDYSPGADVNLTVNGTSGAWVANTSGAVWIVGQDSGTRPNITRKIVIKGSYVYLDIIGTTGSGTIQFGSSTTGYPIDHAVLRNSTHTGTPSVVRSAVTVIGSSSDVASNVVIYNNTLHDCGDVNSVADEDAHVVSIGQYASNVWVLENQLYGGAGSGLQVAGNATYADQTHNIYIGKNHVYNNRQAGLATKYGKDIIISENTIHDIYDTSWSPSKGIGMQYNPDNIWIINNTIHNCRWGVRGASNNAGTWNVYVIGNLIYDIAISPLIYNSGALSADNNTYLEGGIAIVGTSNTYVASNTIKNAYGGINLTAGSGIKYVENNIVQDVTENHHLWIVNVTDADVQVKNNLFYQTSTVNGGAYSYAKGATATSYTSLSAYITGSGEGVDCQETSPLFVGSADLRLQSTSPARDAGILSGVYATFQSLYGIDIKKDIIGVARPMNTVWDIGAYEYDDGAPPTITCYQDADNDLYGHGVSETVTTCSSGYYISAHFTTLTGDCNDNNAALNPGATDVCGNGVDENCSGADAICGATATGRIHPGGGKIKIGTGRIKP